MTEQRRRGKYPDEMRERAVRMVFEAQRHCGSQWEAIASVAEKLGPTPETVRKWVRRTEVDEGRRPGLSSDERERLKRLERENRELRRANEILKSASLDSTGQCNAMLERKEVVDGEAGKAGDVRRGSGDALEAVVAGVVVFGDLSSDRLSAGVGLHGGEADRWLRPAGTQAA